MSLSGVPVAVRPAPAARPPRPVPVRVATALLALVVLGILTYVGIELEDADRLARDIAQAGAEYPDLPDPGPGLFWTFTYVYLALLVGCAAVIAVLALLAWLGHGWARVLAVLASVVSAVCGAVVLGPSALIADEDRTVQGVDPSSFESAVSSLHSLSRPDWVLPVLTVDALVLPPAALAAVVCLLLPASNAFYREARAARHTHPVRPG